MTLCSELIAIKQCKKGDAVGYGGGWVCPEDMSVGVVGIGYGDGYPRHAKEGTPVLVDGKRVRLVGRVSMDMICVDLRECQDAQVGSEVILWGDGLPAEEVAESATTIAYDLFCGVTSRVPRDYVLGKVLAGTGSDNG
jgi:alanine racemase